MCSARGRGSGPRDGAMRATTFDGRGWMNINASLLPDRNLYPGRGPNSCVRTRPSTPVLDVTLDRLDPSYPMAKRSLSPVHLPLAKRAHLIAQSPSTVLPPAQPNSFESLYDELILHVFTFLSYTDLCALQTTDRNLARLSLDNQVHSTFHLGNPPFLFCAVTLNISGLSFSSL